MQINLKQSALALWLVSALVGCNTFEEVAPFNAMDGEDAGSDVGDAPQDTDLPDSTAQDTDTPPRDTTTETDAADADTAEDDTGDTTPDVPDTPIARIEESCEAIAQELHPQLPLPQRPTGALYDRVTLTPVYGAERSAILTWRNGGDMRRAMVTQEDTGSVVIALEQPLSLEEGLVDEGLFNSSGVAAGTGITGSRPLIAFTGSECNASDTALWLVDPAEDFTHTENPIVCPHERPPHYSPTFVGGFNPFEQEVGFAPRLVSVLDGADGGSDVLTSRVYPNVVNRNEHGWDALAARGQLWMEPTHGRLVLLPNSEGGLHVWDASSSDAPIPIATPSTLEHNQVALAYLDDDRYVFAYIDGTQVRIELREHDGTAGTFALTSVIDVLERPMAAAAIGLGTFEGGFFLFHIGPIEDTGEGPMGWTFQPYRVDTGFTRSACTDSFAFVDLEIFDVATVAFREGSDLLMLVAVNYRVLGDGAVRSINVEGPFWSGFFSE